MTLLSHWRDLDPTERVARLRALQTAIRIYAGPLVPAVDALRAAEADPALLAAADTALAELPTIALRRALSTLAATLPSKAEMIGALKEAFR